MQVRGMKESVAHRIHTMIGICCQDIQWSDLAHPFPPCVEGGSPCTVNAIITVKSCRRGQRPSPPDSTFPPAFSFRRQSSYSSGHRSPLSHEQSFRPPHGLDPGGDVCGLWPHRPQEGAAPPRIIQKAAALALQRRWRRGYCRAVAVRRPSPICEAAEKLPVACACR